MEQHAEQQDKEDRVDRSAKDVSAAADKLRKQNEQKQVNDAIKRSNDVLEKKIEDADEAADKAATEHKLGALKVAAATEQAGEKAVSAAKLEA